MLPCHACRVETLRWYNRAGQAAPEEEPEDLAIRLENSEQQQRYEEVRAFRDRYHFPMWSDQWFAFIRERTKAGLPLFE